jgi:hypothetical protein
MTVWYAKRLSLQLTHLLSYGTGIKLRGFYSRFNGITWFIPGEELLSGAYDIGRHY